MHLLDAWTSLDPPTLARLLALPVVMVLATLLPGRGIARVAALVAAVAVLLLVELSAPFLVRAAWAGIWLLVAWQAGAKGHERPVARATRRGGFEAGAVGLPLGLALVALLFAAVAPQALAPLDARRASLGVVLMGVGLLHLMMRRHVRRALLAFASLGVGLELLGASARAADVAHAGAPAGAALLATLFVVALTRRVAGARERYAGSPLVHDAHDLHD